MEQAQQTAAVAAPRAGLPGIGELLKQSWHEAKPRYWQIVGLTLLSTAVSLVAVGLGYLLWWATESVIGVWIYGILFGIAALAFTLSAEASTFLAAFQPPRSKRFFELLKAGWPYAGRIFVTGILYGLGVVIGTALLIVPGIWFALRYGAAMFVVVDENLGAIQALNRSAELTKGYLGAILARSLVYGIIYIVISLIGGGILAFLVGLVGAPQVVRENVGSLIGVFLSPWYILYAVLIYRALKAGTSQSPVA